MSNRKQKKPPTKHPLTKRSAKLGVQDDDFYRSLAASADDDEISDVSDADPVEMAKHIEDLDELDAAIFQPKKTPPRKTEKMNTKKSSVLEMKDYLDDPLAGILSDDEDEKPPAKPLSKKLTTEKKQDSMDYDSDKSQGSKRLEVERPPTRSGKSSEVEDIPSKPTPSGRKSKQMDDVFDDDDVLGGVGLTSPRHTKSPLDTKASRDNDDHRPGGAKSVFNELLGIGNTSKHIEKPGTAEKKHNLLEKITNKETSKQTEEDFVFGAYTPSAFSGSRPTSRRSVRFEESDGDRPNSRSGSAGKQHSPSSHIESMIAKDDRNWLDLASNAPPRSPEKKLEETKRPSSEGTVRGKPSAAPNTASGSPVSESVDWLGLARLGSPDVTPRTPDDEKGFDYEMRKKTVNEPSFSKPKTQPKGLAEADEKLPFPRAAQVKTPPKVITSSEVKDTASNKEDDWLGITDHNQSTGHAYLGLGEDVDPDDTFRILPAQGHKEANDLFSTPQQHMSSSLPLDAERPHGRRDHSTDSHRSSSAERAPGPHDFPASPKTETKPSISLNNQQTDENALFTSPNLFDDTPVLTRGSLPVQGRQPTQHSSPGSQTPEFLLPETTFRQRHQEQQETFIQQQQHLKAEHQKHLQEQQEQQLLMLRQQQQERLKQQFVTMNQTYGSERGSGATVLTSSGGIKREDFASRIHKLEMEKTHMQMIMETMKIQHLEEVKVIEDSYKKRMEMLEDMWQKREKRLREENEMLSGESLQRLKKLEEEKAEMISSQLRQIELWEQDKYAEIRKLKEIHSKTLDELRAEYQKALDTVRRCKDQELEAAISASDHARHLQSVISRVEDHASSLDELQQKVEGQHTAHLDQRETALKSRDHQLKVMQERLERQQHENEQERAKLQALITKLEIQLTEQTRQIEEDKWRIRQEESRLQSAQKALEQERQLLMEQVEKDKQEVEKSKNLLIEEQRTVLSGLAKERQALSQEHAQFNIKRKLRVDEELHDAVRVKQDTVELEASLRVVSEEKVRLAAESQQLALEREKLKMERDQIQQEKCLIQAERDQLEQLAKDVNHKSHDIQDLCLKAAQVRDEGQQALATAQNKEKQLIAKDESLNKQLKILRERERQIAEERLSLAKEKHEFEQQQGAMLCINCRTPVRETNSIIPGRMTQTAHNLFTSLAPDIQGQVQADLTSSISDLIAKDKLIRVWRKSAQKDDAFLTEEKIYLRALKSTPYHAS